MNRTIGVKCSYEYSYFGPPARLRVTWFSACATPKWPWCVMYTAKRLTYDLSVVSIVSVWPIYGDNTSSTVYITCSVPQGLVPGPRLFISYTADLADVVEKHDVNLHAYTLTIHNCIWSVVVTKWRSLPQDLNTASQMSAAGCQPTGLSWIVRRQNWSGGSQYAIKNVS